MGKKTKTLAPLQLAYVANYKGDGTEAARKAGAKNPKQYAYQVMKIPAVAEAIKRKQQRIVDKSADEFVRSVAKSDVVGGIMREIKKLTEWRDSLFAKKRMTATEQNILVRVLEAITKAYREIADMQGWIVSKSMNYDRLLDDLTEEELKDLVFNGNPPKMGGQPSHGSERPSGNPTQSS